MKFVVKDENKDFVYQVNRGTLEKIEDFREFIGEEKFNEILSGSGYFDIPIDSAKYVELMEIIIEDYPDVIKDPLDIPYHHAEELIGFFCEPFAGRSLKQVKSTLTGISSLLQKLNPEVLRTMTESINYLKNKDTDSGAVN